MKIALLLAVCLIANVARAGVNEAMPQEGINPAAVKVWASCAQNFLASGKPENFADGLGGMIATLNNVNLQDPKILKSLAPLAAEIRTNADLLLVPQIPGGTDPQLAAKTLKFRALAETPLAAFINDSQRWRAEGLYRAYHDQLSARQKDAVAESMRPIVAALTVTAAPRADRDDAPTVVAEVHKNGLEPSAVVKIGKAQAYFKEKGIPVAGIRYNEGYSSGGMSPYDGDSWTPESLTVSFADAAAYRRWRSELPRKIGGTEVYPDSGQANEARVHEEVAQEQSLLARARDHFQAKGIPVTSILHSESGLTVSFRDTSVYRAWKSLIPTKFDGVSIFADSKHVGESNAIDEAAARAALLDKAYSFFKEKGFAVKDIKYNEGYYSYGMSDYDGSSWEPATLSVTFVDAQTLARWQKRWFHSAAGLSVRATAAPEPGLGFPDPKDHFAAALSAAQAPDAQFVAASASLNNKSQNWSYLFLSAQTKELITVITDFLGNAALQSRKPARDLMVHPIDIAKVVTLQAAYDAVKSETFRPAWVNLDRDYHGRVLYRFSSNDGKTQVRVDATTGKIAD